MEFENIIGIKDSSGNFDNTLKYIEIQILELMYWQEVIHLYYGHLWQVVQEQYQVVQMYFQN